MLTSVSVLGLGQLGSAVASAFLAHGHPTTVWNRSAGRTGDLAADGAHVVADAAAAVKSSPLVVVVVADYAATRDVLRSAADTLTGRLVVNLASGTQPWRKRWPTGSAVSEPTTWMRPQ